MTEIELNKEYTYQQICKILGWDLKAGNSKKAQIKEIESAYEFYHPENKKTHKQKKSYIFTQKNRDLIEPSKSNCGGAHNIKNIQPMIDYLQAKINPDDNDWYSFTDWYCEKLDLMNKSFCNAVYFETLPHLTTTYVIYSLAKIKDIPILVATDSIFPERKVYGDGSIEANGRNIEEYYNNILR